MVRNLRRRRGHSAAAPGEPRRATRCRHTLPALEAQVSMLVNAYEDAEADRGSVWPLPPESLMATTPGGHLPNRLLGSHAGDGRDEGPPAMTNSP
jgi:hypothetical protein